VKRVGLLFVFSLAMTGAAVPQTPPDPRLEDARKKMTAGDAEGAFAAIEIAVAKHPDMSPAQLIFAGLLFQNGQMAAGRAVMERAAIERPDHPEIYSSFGRLALAEGRMLDAALNFEKAAVLAAADRWPAPQRRTWLNSAHSGSAAVAERRKDWKTAYASLMVMADLNPSDWSTRWRLGRASFRLDQVDQAEELLRSAWKGDKRLPAPESTLADLWMEKGDLAKAEKLLTTALAANEHDALIRNAMTRLLIQAGRGEAARQSAAKGLSMQPRSAEARLLAVLAARQVGDVAAAEAVLTPWLNESPQNPVALSQSAQLKALSKDPAARAVALERAKATSAALKGGGDSQTTLGVVHFLLGDMADAEKFLRAAILSGDANADTAFYLGLILEQKGDREGAVRSFNRALEVPGLFLFKSEATKRRDALKAPKS
jgi:Tfp pilus assembly protein PilF